MTDRPNHIRQGFGAVRPYLYGGVSLIDFVLRTFQAEELERYEYGPQSFQVMARIGDSVVILEAGDLPPEVRPTKASVYVYVEDVDATYRRALQAGAESVERPEDKPYNERGAGVRDPFGNTWWIATYTGPKT